MARVKNGFDFFIFMTVCMLLCVATASFWGEWLLVWLKHPVRILSICAAGAACLALLPTFRIRSVGMTVGLGLLCLALPWGWAWFDSNTAYVAQPQFNKLVALCGWSIAFFSFSLFLNKFSYTLDALVTTSLNSVIKSGQGAAAFAMLLWCAIEFVTPWKSESNYVWTMLIASLFIIAYLMNQFDLFNRERRMNAPTTLLFAPKTLLGLLINIILVTLFSSVVLNLMVLVSASVPLLMLHAWLLMALCFLGWGLGRNTWTHWKLGLVFQAAGCLIAFSFWREKQGLFGGHHMQLIELAGVFMITLGIVVVPLGMLVGMSWSRWIAPRAKVGGGWLQFFSWAAVAVCVLSFEASGALGVQSRAEQELKSRTSSIESSTVMEVLAYSLHPWPERVLVVGETQIQQASDAIQVFNNSSARGLNAVKEQVVSSVEAFELLQGKHGVYDVIVEQPISVSSPQMDVRFSLEYLLSASMAMTDVGTHWIWIDLSHVTAQSLQYMAATFTQIYPYAAIYRSTHAPENRVMAWVGFHAGDAIGMIPTLAYRKYLGNVVEDLEFKKYFGGDGDFELLYAGKMRSHQLSGLTLKSRRLSESGYQAMLQKNNLPFSVDAAIRFVRSESSNKFTPYRSGDFYSYALSADDEFEKKIRLDDAMAASNVSRVVAEDLQIVRNKYPRAPGNMNYSYYQSLDKLCEEKAKAP